jgi:hypothetical protein
MVRNFQWKNIWPLIISGFPMFQTSVDTTIPLNAAHITLARACLLKLGENVDKKRLATFPLAFYATRHWINRPKFKMPWNVYSIQASHNLHHGVGYTMSTGLGFENPSLFSQEHPPQLGESAWD